MNTEQKGKVRLLKKFNKDISTRDLVRRVTRKADGIAGAPELGGPPGDPARRRSTQKKV